MSSQDIGQTGQTNLDGTIQDFQVGSYSPDVAGEQKETEWINSDWGNQVGFFKGKDCIPEFHRSVTALSTWTAGKGFTAKPNVEAELENITGWGNETFDEIMINMINMKKVTGDAYAELIRNEEGTLMNIKVLSGENMKIIVNAKGIIERYEQVSRTDTKAKPKTFTPDKILHLTNDRVADEIHGTSLADIVKWVVTARREAMQDWKRISHRSTIRVMYIDSSNTTKLSQVKSEYATAIKNGELLIIPAKRGEAEFEDLQLPPVQAFLSWIQYLEGVFYQVVGVPRVIATSENFTESGGKIGFLTFEPVYTKEQMLLEGDLWSQAGIKVKFNRPPSLGGDLARDEEKDPQAIQPNDTEAGVGE